MFKISILSIVLLAFTLGCDLTHELDFEDPNKPNTLIPVEPAREIYLTEPGHFHEGPNGLPNYDNSIEIGTQTYTFVGWTLEFASPKVGTYKISQFHVHPEPAKISIYLFVLERSKNHSTYSKFLKVNEDFFIPENSMFSLNVSVEYNEPTFSNKGLFLGLNTEFITP